MFWPHAAIWIFIKSSYRRVDKFILELNVIMIIEKFVTVEEFPTDEQ